VCVVASCLYCPPVVPAEKLLRVEWIKEAFTKYSPQARAVLDALLAKYRDEGVINLDDANVLKIAPFSEMGSVVQLITAFGGKEGFEKAVHELQDALYQETA
jgi:type I restriction enzyme R subunit